MLPVLGNAIVWMTLLSSGVFFINTKFYFNINNYHDIEFYFSNHKLPPQPWTPLKNHIHDPLESLAKKTVGAAPITGNGYLL